MYALAVQADGDILLGGNFNSFDGMPRHGIVRIFGGEHGPLSLSLNRSTNGASLSVSGALGVNVTIESSTNLLDWVHWTSGSATNLPFGVPVPFTGPHQFFWAAQSPPLN